jgi:hypothetical protein
MSAIDRRLQMTQPTLYKIDDSAGLTGGAPEKVEKGFTPPFRSVIPLAMERGGPIIAGGISRFDLGANEER